MVSTEREKEQEKFHQTTAFDWDGERRKYRYHQLTDDGTMSFFWRAHTVTVLVLFILVLFYVSLVEEGVPDTDYNTKRGLVAVVLAFLLFQLIHTPDGPFIRPHPAFWRLVLCLSFTYELALVYLLFQSVEDARRLVTVFDGTLGQPLPETDYGHTCTVFDSTHANPFHAITDKMDIFVISHFFGTLRVRDWWLCAVLIVGFELLEYSLEHQMPNFRECWWDHLIMDALFCNGLGIYLGWKTLHYLSMKPYHWRGMWNIPTYCGKLRLLLRSLPRTTGLNLIGGLYQASSVGVLFACLLYWNYKKLGRQCWINVAIVFTECLIVMKYDWKLISKPLPTHKACCWIVGIVVFIAWTAWKFFIKRDVKNDIPDQHIAVDRTHA